jgi:hypothetical protein
MSVLKFQSAVKMADCAKMIAMLGPKISFCIEGQPGIGKSALLKLLEQMLGDKYSYVYLDGPTLGEGSLMMDVPDRDEKALVTYLSKRLKLDGGKPIIIMIDEFLKVPRLMKVLFTRLLLERVIGDTALPEGSIVFVTSNNSSDGVNDTIEAHVGNRVTRVRMANHTAAGWNVHATDIGVSALTRSWVAMNKRCMASYLDEGQEDNPFIFNPFRAGTGAVTFVSPRSLVKADEIIKVRRMLGPDVVRAALCGTVGLSAAESMMTFVEMEKDIIPVSQIIANPKIPVPDNAGALLMTLFNAVDEIETQDELSAVMQWVNNIQSSEIQGVFFTMALQSKRMARMAMRNADLSKWSEENFEILQ